MSWNPAGPFFLSKKNQTYLRSNIVKLKILKVKLGCLFIGFYLSLNFIISIFQRHILTFLRLKTMLIFESLETSVHVIDTHVQLPSLNEIQFKHNYQYIKQLWCQWSKSDFFRRYKTSDRHITCNMTHWIYDRYLFYLMDSPLIKWVENKMSPLDIQYHW